MKSVKIGLADQFGFPSEWQSSHWRLIEKELQIVHLFIFLLKKQRKKTKKDQKKTRTKNSHAPRLVRLQ
jgi:hypothetical protein